MTTRTDVPRSDSRPLSTSRWPAWLRILLPTLLMLPAAMSSVLPSLIPGVGALMESREGLGFVLAYTVSAGCSLAAYVLISAGLVRWADKRPVSALGLRIDGCAALSLLVGIGVALAAGLPLSGLATVMGLGRDLPVEVVEGATAMPLMLSLAVLLIQAFVLQGIGEEVLFRGFLLQSLSRRPVVAVLVSAAAFGILHLVSSGGQQNALERVLYLAIPVGFAISAGMLSIRLRSVWAAVGIHGGFHVTTAVSAVLGLAVTGPAVWLLLGAGHVVAGVLIALLMPRGRWDEVQEHGPYRRAGITA